MNKLCPACKTEKPHSEFGKNAQTKTGLTCWCKECSRRIGQKTYQDNKERHRSYCKKWEAKNKLERQLYNRQWQRDHPEQNRKKNKRFKKRNPEYARSWLLKKNYGITLDQYKLMLKAQNYRCAICKTVKYSEKFKVLLIDHCHKSNRVRGLLCNECNLILGYAKDSPQILLNAAAYLEKK